ncbi:MAG: hypothetical protein CMJ94_06805 [Planctomycetes bacterium]|nr:hypothetical protein [Planctomycetota bacterium]
MSYQRQQFGKAFLVIVVVLLLVVTGALALSGELLPAFSISAALVLLLACFSWLTVEVTSTTIELRFGLGWVKRSIPLKKVAATEIVRNKWWYGWGIRLTPHGWMWNISGMEAVELLYTDGKCFRIGTDDPAGLKQAIDARLG